MSNNNSNSPNSNIFKKLKKLDLFQNLNDNKMYQTLFIVGILSIISVIVMSILMVRQIKKERDSYQPSVNICPDGWRNISNNEDNHTCEVPESLNEPSYPFKKKFSKNFSTAIYKNKPLAKCKWTNYFGIPWTGIDHLCPKNNNIN
tara:strand:- start:290 stop:727 length:438 start_codon:yes stop_codon:yes gene_type:complete